MRKLSNNPFPTKICIFRWKRKVGGFSFSSNSPIAPKWKKKQLLLRYWGNLEHCRPDSSLVTCFLSQYTSLCRLITGKDFEIRARQIFQMQIAFDLENVFAATQSSFLCSFLLAFSIIKGGRKLSSEGNRLGANIFHRKTFQGVRARKDN